MLLLPSPSSNGITFAQRLPPGKTLAAATIPTQLLAKRLAKF